MVINGRNRLACKVLMKDLGKKVTVEPIRGLPVIKDMVVDMEPFFAKYRASVASAAQGAVTIPNPPAAQVRADFTAHEDA